jgi:organic hydroperoxide reductase OsmC/OhrA
MHPYPHRYTVQAVARTSGSVAVRSGKLPALETNPPPEFDGPEGYWSPEALLVAAVADCYVLSFRAIARASGLQWEGLSVEVEGVLDRADGVTRFVQFVVRPRLAIADAAREPLARTALDKAKRTCLVTNSLRAECLLEPQLAVAAAGLPGSA